MFSILHQPYPVPEKTPLQIFLIGLLAGAFIALFLIIVQPFGTDTVEFAGKNLFLSGYGLIVALVIWLANIVPLVFVDEAKWTVGKQILLIFATVLVGITLSYFYVLLLGGAANWSDYRYFLINAISIAIFPVFGMVLTDYVLKLKRYGRGAQEFNELKTATAKTITTASSLVVTDDQERAIVTLPTNRIWCLRSDRNYVDIFHLDADDQVAKTTVRNTLTRLGTDLPEHFLRCHRSYVVNAAVVEKVSGNAQGYRLHCGDFAEEAVPVSRSKSTEILGFIQAR